MRLGVFLAPRPLQRPDARAHQIGRGDRLDQEIGDLELDEDAHRRGVEFLGNDDDRNAAFQSAHYALKQLDLLELCRIHVDDEGAEIGLLDLAPKLGDILLDSRELDDLRGRERRARVLQESPVAGYEQDLLGLDAACHFCQPVRSIAAKSIRCGRLCSRCAGSLAGRAGCGTAALGRNQEPGVLDAIFPRVDHLHDRVGGLRVAGAYCRPLGAQIVVAGATAGEASQQQERCIIPEPCAWLQSFGRSRKCPDVTAPAAPSAAVGQCQRADWRRTPSLPRCY